MGFWDGLKRVFAGGGQRPEPWPGMGPGHTVSPDEAIVLLRQTDFAHLAPQLEPLMWPAIHLTAEPVEGGQLPMGASRLGGPADLPEGMEWPRWADGPLSLLAQLRLSEMAPYDAAGLLPERGILSFFYDAVNQPWGMEREDGEARRVLYFEEGDDLTRVEPPEELDEWARFAPHAVDMRTVATFPTWQTLAERFPEIEFADDAEEEYYIEWLASITGGETAEQTWLLGWPQEIQGDVHSEVVFYGSRADEGQPDPGEAEDWRLLLQVDTMRAPQWMWGDAGRLYVLIRHDDLAAGRFDETWVTLQCY